MERSMQDITKQMLEFKEAVRHTWNSYFAKGDSSMSPDIQDAFRSVEKGMFGAIVLAPFGMIQHACEYRAGALPFILVKPAEYLRELPLQVFEQQANGNSVLGAPISVSIDDLTAFEFFDYFDWYSYGHVDLPYIRARVASLQSRPSLQGMLVLIEQVHCRFGLIHERASKAPGSK